MKAWGENLVQRFWVDGLDKRLPVVVTLIGILLIANSMAVLTWKLVPVPATPIAAIVNKNTRVTPNQLASAESDQPVAAKISQYHLFGKFEKKKPPPVQVEVAAAPETRLNLKLRGVFSSEDKEMARAIIADAKGEDDSYAIGDEVPGGATLNDIFEDRVILERNGQLETLKLPVESLPGEATAGIDRNVPGARPMGSPSRAPVSPIDTATAGTSEILRHYRDALINDPQSVMGLVRVQPYNKGGRLEGYRIRPGKDRQLLTKFGLRSGDIVKAVNAVPMDNPIKALEILRDLSTATSVTVDIERNGTPRSFTFQIQ